MQKFTILMSVFCLTIMAGSVFADENNPLVKMSKSEICHAPDSTSYKRTKNFTAFDTLEECLASSEKARLPKNYTPKGDIWKI